MGMGALEAQSWDRVFQDCIRKQKLVGGGHVQEVGGRHMTNPLPHPVPSIFNFILISCINDDTAALILFIKAVDSMHLCMASSLNPTERPLHNLTAEASKSKPPLSERDQHKKGACAVSRCLPCLLGPTKEICLNRWWTRNTGVTQRLE